MYRGQYGEYVKLLSNTGKMSTDQLTLFIPSLVVLILCMNISYISFNFLSLRILCEIKWYPYVPKVIDCNEPTQGSSPLCGIQS